MAQFTAPALDFEAMLAREYVPANITRLVRREKYEASGDQNEKREAKETLNPLVLSRRKKEEAASLLVHSLVTQTPAYKRHGQQQQRKGNKLYERFALPIPKRRELPPVPPEFHDVELSDWESKIPWKGVPKPDGPVDFLAILDQPRNHHLDFMDFSDAVAPQTREDYLRKARNAPLILELGVAGQSVANVVYQNTVLSAQRPPSADTSEAYTNRMERKSDAATTSNSNSLLSAKDEKMAEYEARQRLRAQMAEDKTLRVQEALGTMKALGGGKGRTVTSSLMGPGGTERTGRPTRTVASGFHEIEYVEQLDLVNNHTMVLSDWSKVLLRQHLRPKLPMGVVRPGLAWQFQIRHVPAAKKAEGGQSGSSYSMIGTHAGSVSKERLRTEADLSPTEGKLILLEYSEERPPIQMTKGMCSKIVNYYRGDRARCPVSAGGGDRPSRRKRGGEPEQTHSSTSKHESGSSTVLKIDANVLDWVGKLPKKSQKDRAEKEAIDVMPEGVTEILLDKVHGPFIGPIQEGQIVTGLVSNVFVAPLFRQEPQPTDFLMILTSLGGAARAGRLETMGVVLRDLPASTFVVGQTEPRTKVQAPNSQGEKSFMNPFVMFQIARHLTRSMTREGHGLTLDEIKDRALPSLEIPMNSLRQRLKGVATFEKKTTGGIWTMKQTGIEDFPGFDGLSRNVAPEGVAAFESAAAARRRLSDLGIEHLVEKGVYSVMSTGVIMVYLASQLHATRQIFKSVKKSCEHKGRGLSPFRVQIFEKARDELESLYKTLDKRHEVAQFIYEELQLAPWNLTKEFIDVHINGEGTGMMRLTGLGDPTGIRQGFSFIRALETKPIKAASTTIVTDKISGTQNDLRKLSMKEMGLMLQGFGMSQKKIATLKRWDRVHCIRDFSTRASSDGIGDGLERFARGEKMKLSDQKLDYTKRINLIWIRQLSALSAPGAGGPENEGGQDTDPAGAPSSKKTNATGKEDSGSDLDSDEDFEDDLLGELTGRSEANQFIAAQAKTGDDRSLDAKEATELLAFKRENKKEKETRENLKSMKGSELLVRSDRKVIRRRTTKTHPDGRQTIHFKFILQPDEVGRIIDRLEQDDAQKARKHLEFRYERGEDERPPGHAMFEHEDDFDYSQKGRVLSGRRRGGQKRRGAAARNAARNKDLQFGKFKAPKASVEERARKRKKEEEELEVYSASAKRKGTNNRKERGSIRDRRPHVIFAEKLENIRQLVEARTEAAAFCKPVPRKKYPRYYETISHPIDLSAIRKKISDLQYKTANEFLQDFELMKKNAIKFNGEESYISSSAKTIYDFVKSQVEVNRQELSTLERAISDYWNGGGNPPKKQKVAKAKKPKSEGKNEVAEVDGVTVNLDNFATGFDSDTDSD